LDGNLVSIHTAKDGNVTFDCEVPPAERDHMGDQGVDETYCKIGRWQQTMRKLTALM